MIDFIVTLLAIALLALLSMVFSFGHMQTKAKDPMDAMITSLFTGVGVATLCILFWIFW